MYGLQKTGVQGKHHFADFFLQSSHCFSFMKYAIKFIILCAKKCNFSVFCSKMQTLQINFFFFIKQPRNVCYEQDVWQNQCNGKRGKRDLTDQVEVDGEVEGLRGEVGRLEDEVHSRVKRLIETEVVYDQSYPVPPSDLPFASPSQGKQSTETEQITLDSLH